MNRPLVDIIENAICDRQPLEITLKNRAVVRLFPHVVTILEGRMALIGELVVRGHLAYYPVEHFLQVVALDEDRYQSNYTQLEVEQMIHSVRQLNGSEHRLVLKFGHLGIVNGPIPVLTPPFHYFGSPYTVFNSSGDMIWSATIELSDELCQWLLPMKQQMEILAPDEVAAYFKAYTRALVRQRVINLKKAS